MEAVAPEADAGDGGSRSAAEMPMREIAFQRVSFAYP
jgi:hypothetical protein